MTNATTIATIVALSNEIAALHEALQATLGRDGDNDAQWLKDVRKVAEKLGSANQGLISAAYRG